MMATDSERREVARRLRGIKDTREGCGHDMCCDLWSAIFDSDYRCPDLCDECEVAVLNSLADLIEPGDTSQSCRDTVACDPTGRGVDSIYEWCFAAIEGADGPEDELYCSIMSAIEEYRHPERVTARTARPVDREALLAQAKELEKCAWYFGLDFDDDEPLRDRLKEASEGFAECARFIREACGERAS